jgi:hypothetical protein
MEHLLQCPLLSRSDLISCNRCRLAVEAVTFADLMTGDGRRIREDFWADVPLLLYRSHWAFPVEKPTPFDASRW